MTTKIWDCLVLTERISVGNFSKDGFKEDWTATLVNHLLG